MSAGARSFEITLVKEGSFGLRVNELEGLGKLKVISVEPAGCIAKFNQATPQSAICAGDVIIGINGGEASMAALVGAAEGEEVRLAISREAVEQASAPQPHLMGAQAGGERHGAASQATSVVKAQVVGGGGLPLGVPPGSRFEHESYVGSMTTAFAVGGCLCCGCLACCILACPIDERNVYIAPDGRKFTDSGALIV